MTNKPVRIFNIRAKRKNPGLRAQHVSAVKLLSKIFKARLEGCKIGSKELIFKPSGKIKPGTYRVDIGTAGSITLLLQALTFALMGRKEKIKLEVIGGTDVPFSPTADYFKHAYLNLLSRLGYDAEMKIERRGYYPRGGGRVVFAFRKHESEPIILSRQDVIKRVAVFASASSSLNKARVAERMSSASLKILNRELNIMPERHVEYSDSYSDGCAICCVAYTESSVLASDLHGKKGVPSEIIGRDCAYSLLNEIKSGCGVDKHMADHLIPFLAFCGGRITTSEITSHTRTLVWLVSKFLDVNIKLNEESNEIKCEI